MQKILIACVTVGLFASIASAKTCHWSGMGGDGLWTNVNNWVEKVVPGRYLGCELTSGEDCDEAVFGIVKEGAATVIDLDGHICVSNLTFASGAPGYTFGISPEQEFGLCFKGKIECAADVSTTQRFECLSFIGYFDETLGKERSKGSGNASTIRNEGSGLIDFDGGWKYNYNHAVILRGKGDIRVARDCKNTYQVSNYLEGRFISALEKTVLQSCLYKSFVSYPVSGGKNLRTIIIPDEGNWFSLSDWGSPHIVATIKENTVIEGLGTFAMYNSRPNSPANGINIAVSSGKTLKVFSDIELYTKLPHDYMLFSDNGRSEIYGEMRGVHTELRIKDSHILSVQKIGDFACENRGTSIGTNVLEVVFTDGGTFEYAGVGESTDRAFKMTSVIASNVATIRNAGTGTLTLTGSFTPTNNTGILRFDAESAPISVQGTLSDSFVIGLGIVGAHPVTLARNYPFAKTVFYGGTLVFGPEFTDLNLPPLEVAEGESKIVVPSGKTLVVDSVSVKSGLLDFVVPDGSRVRLANGEAHASILVNGYPAEKTEDGTLKARLTQWKLAKDGVWSDSAMWTEGVPKFGWGVEIAAQGGSYTAKIDAPLSEKPGILKIWNVAQDATSTLSAEVPLAFTNMFVTIARGGVLEAKRGLSFTNTTSDAGSFTVSSGGELRVVGGEYDCRGNSSRIKYDGGKVTFAGDVSLMYPAVVTFGTGETVFDENASFTKSASGGNIDVLPNAPGETAVLTLAAANATHHFRSPALVVGGCSCATGIFNSAAADLDDTDPTYIANGGTTFGFVAIGFEAGVGKMNVSGGKLLPGNYGFHIGTTHWGSDYYQISVDNVNAATGIVEMTGGTIVPSGWGYASAKFPCGLVIGDATRPLEGAKARVRGEFYLKGGSVEPNQNGTYIGVGYAEGCFVQTGGKMSHASGLTSASGSVRYDDPNSNVFNFPFVVGLGGGIGSCVISNGTFSVDAANDVFVGGATVADLAWCSTCPWTLLGYSVDSHDAKGLFAVRGGDVSIGGSMYLGCDGTGELELGATGKFSVGGDVVLSNKVASVLRVVLGERSVPDADIAGRIVISDAAKLVVDASAYSSGRIYTSLIYPKGGFAGEFSADNIEIVLPVGADVRVPKCDVLTERDGVKGLWLYQQCGTVISFR